MPPQNVTVASEVDYLDSQDESFMNNPLDTTENVEYTLDFAACLSLLFRSW
jgi:hypothetical protein